ncbi:Methyltransferase type 12 [Paenibacillus curdlanolyticus YK9]|uniref:Methyltransferase type 12 n=1 Tax=Paenibacillus curdlanolyticus YK9 TaxID=717606 RepID=E0IEW2_9BACL|nr:class I SAM-dependent methyltransferase [Paenibacillus curdlanolyticus]EFM09200.1 Methyltransferase type 12 [Paenibacillus curdlanolyticus YK9]
MDNRYASTAQWYDADNRAVFQADIPFYIARAQQLGGQVLELACGTGRITIPLAEAGISVTELDYSPQMLEVLQEKLQPKPDLAKQHIRIAQGNMTSFSLSESFSLIFIPFRSFQLLETDEQALQCLHAVVSHLADNGQFILNVFRPYGEISDAWIQREEQLDFESYLPTREKVTRHSIKKACDTDRRLLYTDFIYRLHKQDGAVEAFHDSLRLRYFYGDELRALIQQAGLTIIEEYGWYDGSPVEAGHEFIFVCQKQ